MKTVFIAIAAIFFNAIFLSVNVYADAEMLPAKSFHEMKQVVNQLGSANNKNTLLVMDDDDTLTMMRCPDQNNLASCQYLGGPAWFSWQQTLLDDGIKSDFEVAKDFDDLLDIAALLLAINYMDYTEQDVPKVLQSLTDSGVKLLVLTARGSSNLSATVNQFSHRKVKTKDSSQSFTDFIEQNALKGNKSGEPGIASPYLACGDSKKPVSYQLGVMYVTGQNKGEMLKCLLESTDSTSIKNIVFIDDTLKNVEDVYASFESSKKYNVKALHYIALEDHKNALTMGKDAKTFQNNANKRWLAIKHVLKAQLQTPALPE